MPEKRVHRNQHDPAETEARRAKVANLYIMDYSAKQIAESLKVPRRTIQDDVNVIEQGHRNWYRLHKSREKRVEAYYKGIEDRRIAAVSAAFEWSRPAWTRYGCARCWTRSWRCTGKSACCNGETSPQSSS